MTVTPLGLAVAQFAPAADDAANLDTISDRLRAMETVVELVVPYDRGDVLAALHREGEVLVESHEEAGMRLRARLDEASAGKFAAFTVTA